MVRNCTRGLDTTSIWRRCLIKAGWTVRLGPDCLETNIVRHLDLYGSLIISDPGFGKQAILKAQTIHVAAGLGY